MKAAEKKSKNNTSVKPLKSRAYMVLDEVYKTSPYMIDNINGKKRLGEHIVGKECAFTTERLMEKSGLLSEWISLTTNSNKRIHDHNLLKDYEEAKFKFLKSKLQNWIASYRSYLTKFYASQDLLPLFMKIRINDKEDGYFIQGFLDTITKKVVYGDPTDYYSWNERLYQRTKRPAEQHEFSKQVAKINVKVFSNNKDISHRLEMIANGIIPPKRLSEGKK